LFSAEEDDSPSLAERMEGLDLGIYSDFVFFGVVGGGWESVTGTNCVYPGQGQVKQEVNLQITLIADKNKAVILDCCHSQQCKSLLTLSSQKGR
jgi:hypothetical protein